MTLTAVLLIAAVVLLIGISKSAFAGALGVFAVPLLMLHFSAIEAVTLLLPILIMADLVSIKSFWRKWDRPLLKSIIPGAVVGVLIGTLLLEQVNEMVLRNTIAIICIAFALNNLCLGQLKSSLLKHPVAAWLLSATSGITSTLVHAGGPPIIIYFNAIGLPKTQFIATAIVFYAILNMIKLMAVISLQLLPLDTVLLALAFAPLTFVGNWLGLSIYRRINPQAFLKVMNLLLLLLGGWLLLA